ncbi:hypothetical protein D3C76_1295470 [compost metagenome]
MTPWRCRPGSSSTAPVWPGNTLTTWSGAKMAVRGSSSAAGPTPCTSCRRWRRPNGSTAPGCMAWSSTGTTTVSKGCCAPTWKNWGTVIPRKTMWCSIANCSPNTICRMPRTSTMTFICKVPCNWPWVMPVTNTCQRSSATTWAMNNCPCIC